MTLLLPLQAAQKIPRYYQVEAIEAIEESLARVDSTLLVMATGTGKSLVAAEIARIHRSRGENILILAHTRELVEQNAKTLESVLGEQCYIEQGDLKAPHYAGVVSASFQSITQDRRLNRFGRDKFQLLIGDEIHRILAPTFRKVFDFFPCKKMGMTATPDRGDEKALGQVFDEVAYVMDIVDGIDAGYLVPVDARNVNIQEVDISHVSLSQGDLAQGELDLAILQGIEGIVQKVLELEPDSCGVLFFPGIISAEAACDRFNAIKPGSACFVHGGTDPDERRTMMSEFKAGRYQYLCQVGIAVEGFDAPRVEFIGWARPTKSRWMFAQGVGRGLRVLPGIVDHLPRQADAAQRRMLIRMSAKPNCRLLNFVGNAGRHSLVTPEDLLGGDYTEAELKEAKKAAVAAGEGGEYDPLEALRESRARLQALVRESTSTVKATVTSFDPFKVLDVDLGEDRVGARYGVKPPTEKQVVLLRARGVDEQTLGKLDRRSASKLLDSMRQRQEQGLASLKQMRLLGQYGIFDNSVTFDGASKAITYIKAKGWGRKGIDPSMLNQLLGRAE